MLSKFVLQKLIQLQTEEIKFQKEPCGSLSNKSCITNIKNVQKMAYYV